MGTRASCPGAVALWLLGLAAGGLAADPLSKEEVARLGKASTALVVAKASQTTGSAFCVHSSGLFLTNEHVVRSGGGIELVLNTGLKTEKTLTATVVRSDKELDLALLRVDDAKGPSALALGSDESLDELAEVIAFGYPFGNALALTKKDHPAISINAGSVTSLRRKNGELQLIQVDIALNPGNSGGPVLDRRGRVIGVVQAGVRGAGVNFVIPVSHVTRFLARPALQAVMPALTAANMHTPAVFQAKAAFLLPADKAAEAELVLREAGGKERRFKMESVDGGYRATAVPVLPPAEPRRLRVTVTYADGTVTGSVADLGFKVGGRAVRLSEARRITRKPVQVLLDDNKTVSGELGGLDTLAVRVGSQELAVALADAVEVRCEPPRVVDSVGYAVIVTQGGKEVGRLSDTLPIARPGEVAAGRPGIKPAPLDEEKVVRTLPSSIADLCVGGGGRLLIFHLPKERKLGVFDAFEGKVVKYLPLNDDKVAFAAGLDKLVIAYPRTNVLQRWSLATFEREVTVPGPTEKPVANVVMGAASAGPVMVCVEGDHGGGGAVFVDLHTLRPLELTWGKGKMPSNAPELVRASDDGTLYGMRCGRGGEGHDMATVLLRGRQAEGGVYGAYTLSTSLLLPSHNGRYFYTSEGVFTSQMKRLHPTTKDATQAAPLYVPARQGDLFLQLQPHPDRGDSRPGQEEMAGSVSVLAPGQYRPLVTLRDIEGITQEKLGYGGNPANRMHHDKRVHLIPDAKLLVTIPATNDRLILRRFDLDELLAKSEVDYLFVTSQPPLSVKPGERLTYQITAKSKQGGVKYRLESGPSGMAVSATGGLTWDVPAGHAEKTADVILSVGDSTGQEVFHTFTLAVQ